MLMFDKYLQCYRICVILHTMTTAQHDAFPGTPDTDPGLGGHNAGREPGAIKRAGQRIGHAVSSFMDGLDFNMLATAHSPHDRLVMPAILPDGQAYSQQPETQSPQENPQPPVTG